MVNFLRRMALKEIEIQISSSSQVKTSNLKKWHIFLAVLCTLIVVFLLSYIDSLLILFFFAPWIPLSLVLVDALLLLHRRQLFYIAIILIWLHCLTLFFIIPLIFGAPGNFYDLHNSVYLVTCLFCIIVNILMIIRESSRIISASAKILVFLCTVIFLVSLFFCGYPGRLISVWVWSVFVIAPILGIIHHIRLFYTGNLKTPIWSIAVICLLSIPLIICAIHLWTLYMPSDITSGDFDLYGKWLEWYKSWD